MNTPTAYQGYSFMEATKRAFSNYFNFSARATLSEFWYFQLFSFIVSFVLSLVIIAIIVMLAVMEENGDAVSPAVNVISIITIVVLSLACIYFLLPGLSLTIRRLHDTGKSGWFYCFNFIPYVGGLIVLIFCCMDSQPGTNEWGPSLKYPHGGYPYGNPYPQQNYPSGSYNQPIPVSPTVEPLDAGIMLHTCRPGGPTEGPFALHDLRDKYHQGILPQDTHVWIEKESAWRPLTAFLS